MSHAHNTSIARSRLGPSRFGRSGDSDGAGPVVTYKLSEEERRVLFEKYGPPLDQEKAERIRMKYRTLATGMGRAGRGKENEEGGEDGNMPPKLDITKEQIESALRVSKGNTQKAIGILRIGVASFYKYVKEFGIDVASFKVTPEAGAEEVQDTGLEKTADLVPEVEVAETAALETAAPETEEQAVAPETAEPTEPTQPAAAEDIFSTWLKVERKNFTGRKENLISVSRRGDIRLYSEIGSSFQPGDRVEFFLSPDKARLAVRRATGIGGFRLRADAKSKAKICNCAELKNLLLKAGVELPARFAAKWDERLRVWIGRR